MGVSEVAFSMADLPVTTWRRLRRSLVVRDPAAPENGLSELLVRGTRNDCSEDWFPVRDRMLDILLVASEAIVRDPSSVWSRVFGVVWPSTKVGVREFSRHLSVARVFPLISLLWSIDFD